MPILSQDSACHVHGHELAAAPFPNRAIQASASLISTDFSSICERYVARRVSGCRSALCLSSTCICVRACVCARALARARDVQRERARERRAS